MDLLVKLYDICDMDESNILKDSLIVIKRAIGPEKRAVVEWVEKRFSRSWASECEMSFSSLPPSCFIAIKNGEIIGFACYDATAKGFFGPIGVSETERKSGVGKALLVRTLKQMYFDGYGYAAIGWVGPSDFFKKAVGAIEIPDSDGSVYKNMVK
jgi:hypothetical protein